MSRALSFLPILAGPTASGKSAAVLALAEALGGEILSIDSMKLYRGLDAGTAKPTASERARVRHHLIDSHDPWQSASVAEFIRLADAVAADTQSRGVPLIGEGGTALYLKAMMEGLFEGPGKDDAVREQLEHEAGVVGLDVLYARLQSADPAAAAKIMPGDQRRIVRALEVLTITGQPISAWQRQWGTVRDDRDVRIICLSPPRDVLYQRIDRRVDAMLAAGWLDECRRLLAMPLSREASQALGYRTLFAHLRGEISYKDARERICFDTHHFARRQLNWFRSFQRTWGQDPARFRFLEVAADTPTEKIVSEVRALWGL